MPPGRRPGPSVTREKIVAAARRQFAEHGYERASLRAIARTAHVDQRLITHFFGSKHGVFVAAMALPLDPAQFVAAVAAPGIDGFGERLAGRWVVLWDSTAGRQLFGLVLVRYVLRLQPLAVMSPEEVARWIGPTIQRYLESDLPARRRTT